MNVWHLYGKVPPESSANKSEIKIVVYFLILTFYIVTEGQKNPTHLYGTGTGLSMVGTGLMLQQYVNCMFTI